MTTPHPDVPENSFPVVAIGASAGGLPALERLLSALPEEFGFALVYVQNLCGRQSSLSPDILRARITGVPIEEVVDGLDMRPGRLYFCPPARKVRIKDSTFLVSPRSRPHPRLPIDEFFFSLSRTIPERTIAVILSGAGTDGSRGIEALRLAGGTVFVQDPETAEYPDMPLAAINTARMDGVFAPAEMVGEIIGFLGSGMAARSRDHSFSAPELNILFRLISEHTGCHFDRYKKSVVTRRVRRRMYLRGITSVGTYLEYLGKDRSEVSLLASDLMIGVTSFFRDPLAWKALRLEVASRLAVLEDSSPIRVWTPACATGEEAYSVAMMFKHELDLAGSTREVHVFATDMNERALERAREGVYPASVAADIPPEYVPRFLTSSGDRLSLTVNKEIRQMVVFARQDLLTDPPFSRIDLVICRNLLIYLEPDAQEKCIGLFHYALRKGGFLFLGNAESPGRKDSFFVPLAHRKCRIYQKTDVKGSPEMPLPITYTAGRPPKPQSPSSPGEHEQPMTMIVQDALLEAYAPAAVAIDREYDIVYHSGPTNRYLNQPRGTPSRNLLEMVPEKLRNRIRAGVYRASREAKPVTIRVSFLGREDLGKQVSLHISRLRDGLFLIVFREKGASPSDTDTLSLDTNAVKDTAVRELENELAATRDDLQSHIEQLRSLNEELESSNEELQAANEEMETSREELRSLNEELITVNTQLQTKVEEQEETNNILANFLASTSIPTLFLDRQMRLRRYTPAMSRIIALIPGDVGRPIVHMSQEHLGPDLIPDARAVLQDLTPVKRELSINKTRYIRTVLPYRTADNRIEGVVVTFADVTGIREAEELTKRLASFPQLNPNPVMEIDSSGNAVYLNPATQSVLSDQGLTPESYRALLPFDITDILAGWDGVTPLTVGREAFFGERTFDETVQLIPEFKVARIYARDITVRKRVEEALRQSEKRVRTKLAGILEPEGDLGNLDLADIIDVDSIDALLSDYHSIARIAIAIVDLKGMVLIGKGWQEICAAFHRIHSETCAHCMERDTRLSRGTLPGQVRLYKCDNHMWGMATPIMVGDAHVGNAFTGQFFFDDEPLDYGMFRAHARRHGFPENEYMRALEAVPRLSRETVEANMSFLTRLSQVLSRLSYSNIKLARALAQGDLLTASLEESEERFRNMFERHKAVMLLVEPDYGAIVDANDAAAAFYGYSRQQLKSLNIQDINLLSPEEIREKRRRTKRGEQNYFVFPHRLANGTTRWVEVYSTPFDARGKPLLFSVIHDITERRRAEEERERTVEFLHLINESNGKKDLMGRAITFFQRHSGCEAVAVRLKEEEDFPYYDACGFGDAFLSGESLLRAFNDEGNPVFDGEGRPVMECVCGNVVRGRFDPSQPFYTPGGSFWTNSTTETLGRLREKNETRTRNRCNAEGYESVALIPLKVGEEIRGLLQMNDRRKDLFSPEGMYLWERLAEYLAVGLARFEAEEALKRAHEELEVRVQERTSELSRAYEALHAESEERKRAEEELRQAHKMEAIGTLAGGIAHDFNNILAAILGFTEMAADNSEDRPEVARNLRHVLNSAHRGKDLVKQILAFSRKSDPVRGHTSLAPVVRETIQLLRASIPSTIEIRFTNTAAADTVFASSGEIQQVLMNLCANSALAMQDRGGALDIRLCNVSFQAGSAPFGPDAAPGEYIQLTVADTGVGMTREVMKRIFEPFFTTREVGKGTGMGLSVVYGIAKNLKGGVTVESQPGEGTVFRVFLPRAMPEGATLSFSQPGSPGGVERILFVDDEELLAEWGGTALDRLGYEVTSFTDSDRALTAFAGDPSAFDLVITDQTMPAMTGVQLARAILSIRNDIPVILCTGHSETVTPDEAKAMGIEEYLLKPLTRSELAEAVRRVLDSRSEGD